MGRAGKPTIVPRDSDRDGLTDFEEAELGTDPNDADSDNDALTDGQEAEIGTDPNDYDSDDDLVSDGDEVLGRLNLVEHDFGNDGEVDVVTGTRDDARWDADGDGELDPGEYVSDPNDPDTDDDGSDDFEETVVRRTDPNDPDTDDDGITDADDPTPGTDDYGPADPRPNDDALPYTQYELSESNRLSELLDAHGPAARDGVEFDAPGPEGAEEQIAEVAKVLEPQLPAVVGPRPGPRGLEPKDDADGPGFGKGDTSSPAALEPAVGRDVDFDAVGDLTGPAELPPVDGDGSLPDDGGVGTKTLPEPEPAAVDEPDDLPDV